jgi:hypothetical protein
MNKQQQKFRGHCMNEGEYKNSVDIDFEKIKIQCRCAKCGNLLEGIFYFPERGPQVIVQPCENCIKKKG